MKINTKKFTPRQQLALKNCNILGKGLEIGPSMNPIAPKKQGFNIDIMDHLNREELIEKFSIHPNMPKNLDEIIEEVDFVWKGQKYTELIGQTEQYDFIISAHLIEHIPNLIQHLRDCSQLLKKDGIYSAIIPDKRYMFDCFRQVTTTGDCINNYLNGLTNHSKGSNVDYFLNIVMRNKKIAWTKSEFSEEVELVHGFEEAEMALQTDEYLDTHESIFTPSSFKLLIADLNRLGFIDFELKSMDLSEDIGEFYVSLKKTTDMLVLSNHERIELLRNIQFEMIEPIKEQFVDTYIKNNRMRKSDLKLSNHLGQIEKFHIDHYSCPGNDSNTPYKIVIRGWALPKDSGFNAVKVYVKVGDNFYSAKLQMRSDVAKFFGLRNAKLGFEAEILKSLVISSEGESLEIIILDPENNYYSICTGLHM